MGIFAISFSRNNTIKFDLGIYQPNETAFNLKEIFTTASDANENLDITVKDYESLQDLRDDLEKNQISVGLSLPTKFSEGGEFEFLLSKNNPSSKTNSLIVSEIVNTAVFKNKPIKTTIANSDKELLSLFDSLAPGLIIYGLIILIPSIAQSFSRITENGYIFRYSFAKISSLEIILGNVLFYFVLGLFQAIILYFTAILFGYKATGNIMLAVVPILLTLFFVVATGLLIGSLFKKSEPATNTGIIISIIFGFFSGSFIAGIGDILEFDFLGGKYQFNDFLPTKWGTVAVEKILTKNLALADIQKELLILAVAGILTLGFSVWTYTAKQLKYQM